MDGCRRRLGEYKRGPGESLRFYRRQSLQCPMSSAHAAADMFVLLSWCCGLYVACLQCNPDFIKSRSWSALLGITATLLELLLDPASRAKKSIQKSALVRTRRALRYVRTDLIFFYLRSRLEQNKESRNSSYCHEHAPEYHQVAPLPIGGGNTARDLRRCHDTIEKCQG